MKNLIERTVKLPITLPTRAYIAIERIATKRGINAHTLIEQLVMKALEPKPATQPPHIQIARYVSSEMISQIAVHNRQHMTDQCIAEQLGLATEQVTEHRIAMKLPSRLCPASWREKLERRRAQ